MRASAWIVASLLAVATIAFAAGAPAALPVHLALLLGFTAAVAFPRTPAIVRALAIVVVLMTLYQSLAEPAFVLMGRSFDPQLASIDRVLAGGHDPALAAARRVTPRNLELFSLIYGIFIPYLWLSILLGCIGRPDEERARFILGLSITYALAYLGYLFVPSRGPVEYYQFAAPLHGGPFHDLVLESVRQTGGNHGAFPSLHVAASAYLCLFDLRRHLLRGLTYLPIVLLIAVSTVFLRYHYLIDILTGFAIAFAAAAVAEKARA
ncbi:MAG: phosphoesterase PA-phosphatase [Acidobacteria bacterium]|nr:phosphoesterase PA-phosphatase [Acidobacteriota bacterium]